MARQEPQGIILALRKMPVLFGLWK